MVDDAASVESLDDKFHAIVHGGVDLDHAVLDDLHNIGSFFNLENLRALVKLGESHGEYDLVDCLLRHTLQIIYGLQDTLQKYLEVVIVPDGSFYELSFEEVVSVEEVGYFPFRDLAKSGVVCRGDGGGAFGVVDEGDLAEDVAWVECTHLF